MICAMRVLFAPPTTPLSASGASAVALGAGTPYCARGAAPHAGISAAGQWPLLRCGCGRLAGLADSRSEQNDGGRCQEVRRRRRQLCARGAPGRQWRHSRLLRPTRCTCACTAGMSARSVDSRGSLPAQQGGLSLDFPPRRDADAACTQKLHGVTLRGYFAKWPATTRSCSLRQDMRTCNTRAPHAQQR